MIDQGTGERIKLSEGRDYHWQENNCVTISIEALESAGIKIEFDDGTYKPMDALEQLEEETKEDGEVKETDYPQNK